MDSHAIKAFDDYEPFAVAVHSRLNIFVDIKILTTISSVFTFPGFN